ncbi:MAG: hypothetical protein IKX63_01775 [Muribaculaceae bacterium]|nr:hypothetical protein [Muribaculaceae bacterium]
MKQKIRTILILMVVLVGVASCGKDEPDGKWAKMEWNDLSGLAKVNGVYMVPAAGGTYTFECKNYKPWIDHCEYGSYDMVVSSSTYVYSEWFEIIIDGNIMTVIFQPIEEASRHLNIVLTAGDIFDNFYFEQHP